jgi:hypothetical protein
MLSTISPQLNAVKAVFTACQRAAGSGYGRPRAIIVANDADAQHSSTPRSAASGGAALNAASVEACGSVLTTRTSNQPVLCT